jgi:plasmid stability protein
MKRALVQLDEETYRKIRQRAFRQERSISAVVRELLAKGLEGDAVRDRPARVSQFSSVRAGRSQHGRLAPVSENHDAALATVFKK